MADRTGDAERRPALRRGRSLSPSFREESVPLAHGFRRVHVIVNPASGRNRPILNTLNDTIGAAGIDWDVSITKRDVPADVVARRALETEPELLAVYGGDGTVMGVASALIGSDTPLAILPGGTSNALSLALDIPTDLEAACRLIASGKGRIRRVDVGRHSRGHFLVGLGIGIPGDLVAAAEREDKDRFGTLAYLARALQALGKARPSRYHLTLDDEDLDVPGVTCLVSNAGTFGLSDLPLAGTIYIDDGLLDVLVIRDTDIGSILSVAASLLQVDEGSPMQPATTGIAATPQGSDRLEAALLHWQVRRVTVNAEPPQAVQVDGEVLEPGPISAVVLPGALRVLVPAPAGE